MKINIIIDEIAAISIIGNLQLALRHPENTGEAAQITVAFIRMLQKELPLFHDLIEKGFDPEFDMDF